MNPNSLWLDDAWQALANRVSASELSEIWVSAPGFTALVSVIGFEPSILAQAPALVFGAVSVVLLIAATTRLTDSWIAAGITGVLAVAAPASVELSTRVKPYTFDMAMVAVSILIVLRILRMGADASARQWYFLGAVTSLGVSVSATSAVGTCSVLVTGAIVAQGPRAATRATAVLVSVLSCLVIYVALVAPNINQALISYWVDYFIQPDALDSFRVLARASVNLLRTWAVYPAALTFLLAVVGGRDLAARGRTRDLLVLVSPLVAAVAVWIAGVIPLGTTRGESYLLPPVVLLISLGMSKLLSVASKYSEVLAVGVLVGTLAWGLLYPYARYPLEDVRPLVAAADSSETLIVNRTGQFAYALYSGFDIDLQPSSLDATAFDPVVEHSGSVFVVPDELECNPQASPYSEIRARHVSVLVAHSRSVFAEIDRCMTDIGYVRIGSSGDLAAAGAALYRYERLLTG